MSEQQAVKLDPRFGRFRKPLDYVRHGTPIFRPQLENADVIIIEPFLQYGAFVIAPNYTPVPLPRKRFNIATKWTTYVPKVTATTQPSIDKVLEDFDVQTEEIAAYKLLVADPGVQVVVNQPEAESLFQAKSVARRLTYSNTTKEAAAGNWSAVPEFYTFENKTRVQLTAYSSNTVEDVYWARIEVYGFKYKVRKVTIENPDLDPRVIHVIRVGTKQPG